MESIETPHGVSMESMETPPKIHRFYGEAMDFWTMVSFGEIYPCRSVIVSILILAHFVTASTLLQVDAVIYLPTHILFFFILAESLKSVIHNEKKIIIILTTYNIGGYNIDTKIK